MTGKEYLEQAEQLASTSQEPVGCGSILVDKQGEIIASNFNSQRADNLTGSHAEMKSIAEANKKLGRKLSGVTAYGNCEPCTMCLTALIFAGVNRIVFSKRLNDFATDDRKINIDCFEFVKNFPYQPKIEQIPNPEIQKFTLILFRLPDGKIILQRRTKDAPYAPGKLGIFGGWVEEGETVDECLIREIKEETSLNTDELQIKPITDFIIPAGADFDRDRHFYLYETDVKDMDFDVYEGDRAEAFSLEEIKNRTDLTGSADYTFNNNRALIL
jgi:tRNA(Arg) A34 adenosine deaminase TadA